MTEFNLAYQLTRADLSEYQAATMKRVKARARQQGALNWPAKVLIWLGLAIAAAMVFHVFKATDREVGTLLAGYLIGAVTVVLALQSKRLTRAMLQDDGPTLSAHKARIDEAALRFDGTFAKARYDWSGIIDATELPAAIVLWLEPGQGVILPKRAFKSETEAKAFLAFAHTQIAAAALTRAAAAPPKTPA